MDNNTGVNNANMDVDSVDTAAAGYTGGPRTIRQEHRWATRGTRWGSRNSISHGSVAGSAGIRPSSGPAGSPLVQPPSLFQRSNLQDPTVTSPFVQPPYPIQRSNLRDPTVTSHRPNLPNPLSSVSAPVLAPAQVMSFGDLNSTRTSLPAGFYDSFWTASCSLLRLPRLLLTRVR